MRTKLILLFLVAQTAFAASYQPRSLKIVYEKVKLAQSLGQKPVIIFDLDDTLLDARERALRIFHDFGRETGVKSRYPSESALFRAFRLSQMKYTPDATFRAAGIRNQALITEAKDYWTKRFFSNRYCAYDVQIEGASAYVNSVYRAGATVIYLTGRSTDAMRAGTVANLLRNRMPYGTPRAGLITKQDPAQPDTEFKRLALAKIAALGKVVGVFENEPANLNVLAAYFPRATAVFLDTAHSERPDVPVPSAFWVRNYTGRE